MIYMLDTNICIYTMKQKPPGVFQSLRKLSPESVCISAITEAELRFGMSNSSRPEHNHLTLDHFLAPFEIAPFDSAAAAHYGDIRAFLRRNGIPIGNMDLLIAAHARSLSATLVTNNVRQFERAPELRLENWA